jgi:hypothetical protein
MKIFLTFFIFFGGIFQSLQAQKIVTFPLINKIPLNNDFSVKVRTYGGSWQDLSEYQVLVDMHQVRKSSMVYFDFEDSVEISVTSLNRRVNTARIRPLSYNIKPVIHGDTVTFWLHKPCNISIEINGDIFHNLHVFTNSPEKNIPDPNDTSIIYLASGIHSFKNDTLLIPSGKTLYLEGGALVNSTILCKNVSNVKICGRGIIVGKDHAIAIDHSKNIEINDLIVLNSQHYTVMGGQSNNITIKNIRSFSAKGWADGIDLMSCSDVLVDGVFLRTSDDCIAIYGHRWNYYGDSRNITVQNSVLWADVAHPVLIGTHGNSEKPEIIENINFVNIDILNHDEPQINYQGCLAINVSDENLARNILFDNIRIEDFEQGQLVNLRVTYNKKYAKAPGAGIENVYFKNIDYKGKNTNLSIIEGYSDSRCIRNIVFENLVINGTQISDMLKKPGYMQLSDFAKFYIGNYTDKIVFKASDTNRD